MQYVERAAGEDVVLASLHPGGPLHGSVALRYPGGIRAMIHLAFATPTSPEVMIPLQGIAEFCTRIPGCGLEIWQEAGHPPIFERPTEFAAMLGVLWRRCVWPLGSVGQQGKGGP